MIASATSLNPRPCSASPGTGKVPPSVSATTERAAASRETTRPSGSSACGHIGRSGTTTWRGLEGAGGRLGEQRRVQHEVVGIDDGGAALAEESGDVGAREAAAADERPPDGLSALGHRPRIAGVQRQVSVIGSGSEHEAAAEKVGRLLAERGCAVVTGGLGEVMAAAHRGAKSAGGTTIAILPGESRLDANRWADHVVVSGVGHARNLAVAASGDAVIAVGGSWGTLAEIAFAMRLGRPVVVLDGPPVEGVPRVSSPEAAVEAVLARL